MYYCDECRKENNWPEGFIKSHGPCEVCDKFALCSDIPAKDLSKIKQTK